MAQTKNDFSQGSIIKHIISIAGPMMVAQLINILYNIVDRIFIGHIPENATMAMSGLGICLPIVTIITAFTNLFGQGGAPLCSIERGRGDNDKAEKIMANSFMLLMMTAALITTFGLLFQTPILRLFGASEATLPYAKSYLSIYLIGVVCMMTSLGMNAFINAQGFAKVGMMTIMIGAAVNLILDPIFIFGFHLGVRGAALATIMAQGCSAIWTLNFLLSNKSILKLKRSNFHLEFNIVKSIFSLGTANFMMGITTSLVSVLCNSTLQRFGGDVYIAIMTVINSIREVSFLPASGLTNGSQPILGFNYGAKKYQRVIDTIKIMSIGAVSLIFVMWAFITLFPQFLIGVFTTDQQVLALGPHCIRLYFFGYFAMALQMVGQSVAVGLGKSKQAIFFSIFRKVIIVAPLTLILPPLVGIDGVFYAECISNFVGGGACYMTMLLTIYRQLKKDAKLQEDCLCSFD